MGNGAANGRACRRCSGACGGAGDPGEEPDSDPGDHPEPGVLEAGGLSRNVALIRELNSNIARVVDLYNALSCSFSSSSPTAPPRCLRRRQGAYKRPRPTVEEADHGRPLLPVQI
ncbi:hypothetical protein ZWY2020_057428 [Hordeum vulgare]|nr:hypothetical protein ZWY2020_057428 [Hordeum vulgare]